MKKYFLLFLFLPMFLFSNLIMAQNKNATVETTKLTGNIYKLEQNKFVNIFAFVGPDGIILVDAGFDKNLSVGYLNSPSAIKEELKKLGNDNIRYIINTHTDDDHAYGNAERGAKACIISHQLARERLSKIAKFSKEGLPNITFQDSLHLYFNNEEITMFYLPGHTNHDVVIHFKNAKVVCIGDLIIPDSFGSISRTGDVSKLIKSIDWLYNNFSDETIFAAAHDRTLKRDDLKNYKNMIEKTLEIVTKEINADKSLDDMLKSDILKDWKQWDGKYFKELNANAWISMLYVNVIKKYKQSASEKIAEMLITSSFEKSKAEIKSIISKKSEYYLSENEFNALGYTLINKGKLEDAIELFKLNVEMYPDSWNVYDSLGEGLMNNGKKELAVENYERSLKMNPKNTNAIKMLEKLKK